MHEHLCQRIRVHASSPVTDEIGPYVIQRSCINSKKALSKIGGSHGGFQAKDMTNNFSLGVFFCRVTEIEFLVIFI